MAWKNIIPRRAPILDQSPLGLLMGRHFSFVPRKILTPNTLALIRKLMGRRERTPGGLLLGAY